MKTRSSKASRPTPRRKNKATAKKKASTIKKLSIASKAPRRGSDPNGKQKPTTSDPKGKQKPTTSTKPLENPSDAMPPETLVNYKLDVVFGKCTHSRKLVATANWFARCSDRAGEIFLVDDASTENVHLLARGIVQGIRDKGGRFLKYDPKARSWEDTGDGIAVATTSCEIRDALKLLGNMKKLTCEAFPEKSKSSTAIQRDQGCNPLNTPQRAQLKNLMKLGRIRHLDSIPRDVATSALITIPDFPGDPQTRKVRSSAFENNTPSSLTKPAIIEGNFSQKLAPRSQPQPMEWSPPRRKTAPEGASLSAMVDLAQGQDCNNGNSKLKGGKGNKTQFTGKTESILPPPALVRKNSDTLVKLMRETSLAANDANNQPCLRDGVPASLLSPIRLPTSSLGIRGLTSSSPSATAATAAVTEMSTSARFFASGDREMTRSFPGDSGYNRSQGEESKPYKDCSDEPVELPLELPAINTTVSQDISDFMKSSRKSYRGRKSI